MADNLSLLQPKLEHLRAMCCQKRFYFLFNFEHVRIRRLLQICKLICVQGFNDTINIILQFLVIYAIELRKFVFNQTLAVCHTNIGGLLVEPFFEKCTICANQLPGFWRRFFGIIYIDAGHFCIKGIEINLNIFIFQGKAFAQMLQIKQDIFIIAN